MYSAARERGGVRDWPGDARPTANPQRSGSTLGPSEIALHPPALVTRTGCCQRTPGTPCCCPASTSATVSEKQKVPRLFPPRDMFIQHRTPSLESSGSDFHPGFRREGQRWGKCSLFAAAEYSPWLQDPERQEAPGCGSPPPRRHQCRRA